MAFLFKSKKNHDRALSSRDGNSGSQGSIQSAGARIARDDKNAVHRATPTGSLNSVDEIATGSPEQIRRGGSLEQVQPSDLAVSHVGHLTSILHFLHPLLIGCRFGSFVTAHRHRIPMPPYIPGRNGG